jgi:hypothetical protein
MSFGGTCHEGPNAPLSPVAAAQTEAAPTAAIRVSRKRFAQDSPAKLALSMIEFRLSPSKRFGCAWGRQINAKGLRRSAG